MAGGSIAPDTAVVVRALRPDLKLLCADIARNAELQKHSPDDPDFKAAGVRLAQELDRQACA